jgi:uncharacterized protein (DUF885 family)
MSADEAFENLTEEMLVKYFWNNPDYATQFGLHDPYDFLLPEGTSERYLRDIRLLEETLARLSETVKRKELNDQHDIDWQTLEKTLDQWRFSFYEQRMHELNPDAFSDLGGLIFMMITRDYAPLEKRVEALEARIERIPKFLEEFRSRFRESKPVRLWTEIAIETAEEMGGLFQFVLDASTNKVSDELYARLSNASEKLQPELTAHLDWLKSLLPIAGNEWALGRERFERLVEIRELGMNSEEILQLGLKYLDELKAERDWTALQIAPKKSSEEVLKTIEADAPKTFEEALENTRITMEEARAFVQTQNIATVYPDDVLMVEETPGFLTPLIPFAALSMPARFDKKQIGMYIVTRPKDLTNLGKHLNYSSIRSTVVHEAFPGHFLQGAVSDRGSVIQLLLQATETIEGWAHYCEQMMAEKGFITGLQTHLIQVNDMIWRAVRIIVDVKLSRGEMLFEEAVDMLVKEASISREGAIAEVRRYTQTPGYSMSYLLGKHLILQLKEEQRQKMGSRFDEKSFHDTITANGYLPISILRRIFDQKVA